MWASAYARARQKCGLRLLLERRGYGPRIDVRCRAEVGRVTELVAFPGAQWPATAPRVVALAPVRTERKPAREP
ncbi:hypothetical protein EVAR_91443_1 [Eumeta japonica]|uniref:Uncharacterized protein n=1 Tax=Eumeta variegata TaxID=151549 RepID=A0A4C1WZI5_EUMVA|nr:hypothetical protein EVAR_91443_1 [Eumeta japonica]